MSEDNDSSSEGSAGSDVDEAATPSPAKTTFFPHSSTHGDTEQHQATGEGGAGEDARSEGEEGDEHSEASVVSDDEEVCLRVCLCSCLSRPLMLASLHKRCSSSCACAKRAEAKKKYCKLRKITPADATSAWIFSKMTSLVITVIFSTRKSSLR